MTKGYFLLTFADFLPTLLTLPPQEKNPKRTAKDSVFVSLFRNRANVLRLYQALHQEDAGMTADRIETVTLENVLTDNLYNDLGILVDGDRLLSLVEAQSTWSVHILVRMLFYKAQTYREHLFQTKQDLYSNTKLILPSVELYVIYTGARRKVPGSITLPGEFFEEKTAAVVVTATVLYEEGKQGIIAEYIAFCHVLSDQVSLCIPSIPMSELRELEKEAASFLAASPIAHVRIFVPLVSRLPIRSLDSVRSFSWKVTFPASFSPSR